MRLNSVLRRVWSTPDATNRRQSRQKPPPRTVQQQQQQQHFHHPPAHLQQQERAVIASYRSELDRLTALLQAAWHTFDAEPHEYHITLQLRELRVKLTPALESYYAACGARSNFGIQHVVDTMSHTDDRLARLDHEVIAEVERFEQATFDISARFASATTNAARLNVTADADDALIELELYQDSWSKIMDGITFARLERTHSKLRHIASATQSNPSAQSMRLPTVKSYHPPPSARSFQPHAANAATSADYAQFTTTPQRSRHETSSGRISSFKPVTATRHSQKRASRQLSTFDSFRRGRRARNSSHKLEASMYPERDEKQLPGFSSAALQDYDTDYVAEPSTTKSTSPAGKNRSAASSTDTTDIISADPEDENSSNESGDEGPMQMVMARNRTLRDMAESARNVADKGVNYAAQTNHDPIVMYEEKTHERMQRSTTDSGATTLTETVEQPALVASSGSFASTLYQTRNARVHSISDAGVLLRRSAVRGDGRCLFRSLVRGRAVARGKAIPGERVEREAADNLRARAVAELKKHQELLARFFVIEGNFTQYTKKMSQSRTYGGEPELLMLAKLLHAPIAVYISKQGRYRQIQVYGKQYHDDPLRILYSDGTHYDALLEVKQS